MGARSTSRPDWPGALARLSVRRRLLLALALAALVAAIGLVQPLGLLAPVDRLAMKIVAHLRWWPGAEYATGVARLLDRVGEGGARIAIACLVALFLAYAGRPGAVLWLLVATAGMALINPLVKLLFLAPRPDMLDPLIAVSSSSFPSGHAAGTMALYGALALLSRSLTLWLICVAMIAATGASRVWLGVHWPSDVIGGWAEGAAWLLVLSLWLPRSESTHKR
ncbi:MAG: hypothetical protein BGP16_06320 [Sphingobium sp. 66-54]|nr:MAG: hypothetical protein BGP16_06320 [Sphingobium sp. 66-54]